MGAGRHWRSTSEPAGGHPAHPRRIQSLSTGRGRRLRAALRGTRGRAERPARDHGAHVQHGPGARGAAPGGRAAHAPVHPPDEGRLAASRAVGRQRGARHQRGARAGRSRSDLHLQRRRRAALGAAGARAHRRAGGVGAWASAGPRHLPPRPVHAPAFTSESGACAASGPAACDSSTAITPRCRSTSTRRCRRR